MIIRVGDIGLRIVLRGNHGLEVEKSLRYAFSGFLAPAADGDASLTVFLLPEMYLDGILLYEEKEALKGMLEHMEKRFPFARFPYEWITGFHSQGREPAVRPSALPSPFMSSAIIDRFSLVPLRQCLLALNHDDHQAVALVRGREVSLLMNAVTLAVQGAVCMLAPKKGAVLLHGASAVIHGAGTLFLGVSGAGKSTIAAALPGDQVFSDESTLCCMDHGIPMIAATPFSQASNGAARPGPAPLKKVFFLRKDKENAVTEMSPGTALARMLYNHIHFFSFLRNQEALDAFRTLERVTRHVPAFVLRFTPHFDPLRFFEEAAHERKKAL